MTGNHRLIAKERDEALSHIDWLIAYYGRNGWSYSLAELRSMRAVLTVASVKDSK